MRLTGILSTGGERAGYSPPWGTMITKDGLYAPIHQHFWVVRLDMSVDGVKNTVMEVNTVRLPAPRRCVRAVGDQRASLTSPWWVGR